MKVVPTLQLRFSSALKLITNSIRFSQRCESNGSFVLTANWARIGNSINNKVIEMAHSSDQT
jgi:hypothetical protein